MVGSYRRAESNRQAVELAPPGCRAGSLTRPERPFRLPNFGAFSFRHPRPGATFWHSDQERVPRWISARARLRGRSPAGANPRRRLPKRNVMAENLATAGENPCAEANRTSPRREGDPHNFFFPPTSPVTH